MFESCAKIEFILCTSPNYDTDANISPFDRASELEAVLNFESEHC